MDRTNFAACAVFALPLAILGTGCGAHPSGAKPSSRTAAPAVLAELERLAPSRRPAAHNEPGAIAAQWDEDDPATVIGPVISETEMRFLEDGAPSFSTEPSVVAATPSPSVRPLPVTLPVEPLDAPVPPEPDTLYQPQMTSEQNNLTIDTPPVAEHVVRPDSVEARIIIPSGEADMQAPSAGDQPTAPEAPATPVQPIVPARPAAPEAQHRLPRTTETAPERAELPWNHAAPRGPEMVAVAQRADIRVQTAFRLAERGALYSARAEFIAALQVIAQANDTEQNTRLYTQALTNGLVALRESSDFVRPLSSGAAPVDVARAIASHKTTALKQVASQGLAPLQAAQRYYTYAQEQLACAAAQERTGSMALFGLAKVSIASAGQNKALQFERSAQAMTLYQAALISEPKNFLAANELGVLLAQNGNLPRARDWLLHSVSLSPTAATWRNLATIHDRLGEKPLADHARARAETLSKGSTNPAVPSVKWLDAESFANSAPVSDAVLPPATAAKTPTTTGAQTAATPPQAKQPPAATAKKGFSDYLPWNSRR